MERSDDTLDDRRVFTIEQAFEKAGGFGLYQWIYCSLASLIFMPAGFFIYNQGFLTLKQVMMCQDSSGQTVNCDKADIGEIT